MDVGVVAVVVVVGCCGWHRGPPSPPSFCRPPPIPSLLQALQSVGRFLGARENNLRYAGIDTLTRLVRIDPAYAQPYQLAVVDCLRSPDDTLKHKTLQLLYKMAGPTNIEVGWVGGRGEGANQKTREVGGRRGERGRAGVPASR